MHFTFNNILVYNADFNVKIHKNTQKHSDMFRSQQIITREYVCTSLKLLNYLKNTEFKILNAQHHAGHHVYLLYILLPQHRE